MANYTLSNATDNMPAGTEAVSLGGGSAGVLPWYYPNAKQFERGPSDFDRRHVLVISYVWQLPLLSHSNWVLRGAIGGWQVSGIVSAMTGLPLTVGAGLDQSKTGIGSDRGQLVSPNAYGAGACGSVAPCVNYLNPQAFALPAVGTFGNLGKGSLRSPGLFNWDAGVNKIFPIKERLHVQFRAEFFNASNRVNFNAPTSSVNSAGFGSVVSSADPRIGQLALKILF
jgi:hypothetical protein